MNWWPLLIALHALSGVTAFIAGLAMLSPRRIRRRPWLIPLFIYSLAVLIVGMVGAMASHWQDITRGEQLVYSGLVLLAGYMLYRSLVARRKLLTKPESMNYIHDVGFPLISLFNGFVIVALIDLQAPVWLVAAGAVAAALIGNALIGRRQQ